MLEKKPDERPSSCEAVVETLKGRGKREKTQPVGQNENPHRKGAEDELKDSKDIGRGEDSSPGGGQVYRGADLIYALDISLEQAANGLDTTISVPSWGGCNTCHGSGAKLGTSPTACFTCGGSGLVEDEKTLAVKIPRGIDDGMRIRSTGNGEPSMDGGPPGDLCVDIHIQPHAVFRRDGDDLHCEIPIPFHKAATGGEIEVPTLSGKVAFTVPAGTQSGKTFRLRGKGIKGVHSGSLGDLYCHILVETSDWEQAERKQKQGQGDSKKTGEINSAENWAEITLKIVSLIGPILFGILTVWILIVMWLE
jgi:DnaJ-class molecular chaperone